MWLALFEWLGTGLFLLGINYSEGTAWIIVASLFIAIILTGRIGGGHFNMGVTVAVYIIEGRNWKKNLPIALTVIVADILGAYTGIGIACGLQQKYDTFILKPEDSQLPLWHVYIIEAIFTILFVGVIVHTKYAKTAPTNDSFVGAITVVLTLLALIGMVGSDSGGCFNPTIGLTVSTF